MKILWTMSSVGLGHLIRDLVIIDKILELSDIKIDLLVPYPNTNKIPDKYNVVEESSLLKGSGQVYYRVFEHCSDKYDLLSFIKEDGKCYKNDFKVTMSILKSNQYSAIVGDEAFWLLTGFGMKWDKKNIPFIFITDFISIKAMDRSLSNKLYAWFKNWQFCLSANVPDMSIFIGSINDIPDERFGFLLPQQRRWALQNYHFIKPVLKLNKSALENTQSIRKKLNLPADKEIYVAVISKAGDYVKLQDLISQTFRLIKKANSDSYFIVISPQKNEMFCDEHYTFLNDLTLYFSASDFVITQAGYGKIIELSALGKPFISIPLDYHFEQEYLLNYRIKNYKTGSQVLLRETNPQLLLDEIRKQKKRLSKESHIDVDDGSEAAKLIINYLN